MSCAVITTVLYWMLVYTSVFKSSWIYPGWIFLVHVGLAVLGLVLALVGMKKRAMLSTIALVVCAYFVMIQLVL